MRTCIWYRIRSTLEAVPSYPKGLLPLSLRAYVISDWGYCPVVSKLWASITCARGVLQCFQDYIFCPLNINLLYVFMSLGFRHKSSLAILYESDFHRKERDSQLMVRESHESVRWSSYSPRPVFVFATLDWFCVCVQCDCIICKEHLVFVSLS